MIGQRVLSLISESSGKSPATLARMVRDLRESAHDVWPTSGRGGRRAARHVTLRHLSAFLLAWGQGAVVGAADAAVELGGYKNLYPQKQDFSRFDPEVSDLLATLSRQLRDVDALAAIGILIDWLAQDAVRQVREQFNTNWCHFYVAIEFRPDLGYSAYIRVHGGGGKKWSESELGRFHELYNGDALIARMKQWPAGVAELRTFEQPFLDILADCWRDTKAHDRTLSGSSSGSSTLPDDDELESETPTLPGAGVSSHLDQLEGDKHPTTRPRAFETRGNGRSLGSIKASPEASALGYHPQHRTISHAPDHRQPALV